MTLLACVVLFTPGVTRSQQVMTGDAGFLRDVAIDQVSEIALAEIALVRADREGVRMLAAAIKLNHQAASRDLRQLAAAKGVALPDREPSERTVRRERLEASSGWLFDQAYLDDLIHHHRRTIARYRMKATAGADDVKAFALKNLPALEDQLQRAEALARY